MIAEFNIESRHLRTKNRVVVILPDHPREDRNPRAFYESGQRYPVLFLLHGTYGDASDWIRKTNVELYASEHNLAVVLPSALNTNYENWPDFSIGYLMYDYFFEELLPFAHHWLPISSAREDNFIAGLSMGAWGAALYALNAPQRFAGAAMLSGFPIDVRHQRSTEMAGRVASLINNYPGGVEEYLRSRENTWRLCAEKAAGGELPALYFAIGEQDFMYQDYLAFKDYAREIGLEAVFEEVPGYGHEWRFWDRMIQEALRFFGFAKGGHGNRF